MCVRVHVNDTNSMLRLKYHSLAFLMPQDILGLVFSARLDERVRLRPRLGGSCRRWYWLARGFALGPLAHTQLQLPFLHL